MIEHDTFTFTLCDRVLVLGELLVEGGPEHVRGDPFVVKAYHVEIRLASSVMNAVATHAAEGTARLADQQRNGTVPSRIWR